MISLLVALAIQSAAPAQDAGLQNCLLLVKSDPQKAVESARSWQTANGGVAARQCLGLAYVALERWGEAAEAFEQAARDAASAQDSRQGDLLVQAGNSWLAAGQPQKAIAALDSALLILPTAPELRGEIYLDRARAGVALDDLTAARADLDRGLELVPGDPFAWYLSAALAQREGNSGRVHTDIAKAVEMAPDDADILLFAGNVAGRGGDMASAKSFYARAAKAAPNSDAGRAAQAALSAEGAAPPQPQAQPKTPTEGR